MSAQAEALKAILDGEREFGVMSADKLASMSGLEAMRGVIDGRFPAPPITKLMRFALTKVERGLAVFEALPTLDYYNPLGSVHGGVIATLLDSALGCSIHTTLEAGQGYITLEFKVSFIKAITENTGPLRAEGRVLNVGRRSGTAEARLTDAQGRLLAHATTTCLVFDVPKQ